MTDLRKAAEMALASLESIGMPNQDARGAIEALRQALAQKEQEHVAWSDVVSDGGFDPRNVFNTEPQKREWVGLTDEERRGIREWQEIQKELGPVWSPMMLYLYVSIEAKLKEKNA